VRASIWGICRPEARGAYAVSFAGLAHKQVCQVRCLACHVPGLRGGRARACFAMASYVAPILGASYSALRLRCGTGRRPSGMLPLRGVVSGGSEQ